MHENLMNASDLLRRVPTSHNLPTNWNLLLVENNPEELKALTEGLVLQGHTVRGVNTGSDALAACERADLVLLDLELPDLDGLEVCRAIRMSCDKPIIAVTARGTELDRVLGLHAGADDYLVKPYGFRELIARIDAVMRRSRPRTCDLRVVSRGPLWIDANTREVHLDGKRIDITRKEFDLLYLLACNPDTVVSREWIMDQVWSGSWSLRTVDTHVSSLRGKLGASGWIMTIRGVGFRLGMDHHKITEDSDRTA